MQSPTEDIAIVGMAGLYPAADDIDVLWSNILGKIDAVVESPDDWLGNGDIFDPDSDDILKIYTRRGGFLGDLSRFDARANGTMPLSVSGGQPDQLLALKLASDALIDAGYIPGKFDGGRTGVILGHAVHAHRANTNGMQQAWFHAQTRGLLETLFPDTSRERIAAAVDVMQSKLPRIAREAVPGLVPNILSGRIANRLDLMGPNYIIDAACASSLISIDLAISELRAGRADMMLAGGVNTTTSPLVFGVFCSVGALSRNGKIRPFDANANGTVLGEGVGMVVLKRLADAVAADDRIYAVIKTVGQSSDGKSSGLMAPRLEGEVLAVERAYRQCAVDPATIGLIEAHGTGIPLGDRTEIDALRKVFGTRKGAVPTIPIGSIKSMIGHCIPASGSAAIIKTALALRHKILPPTLCDEVNASIGLESTPFYISTEARPWIHSGAGPRRAAINAFGFGGINAHMVLEESPVGRAPDPTAAFVSALPGRPRTDHVFAFAGVDRAELTGRLDAFRASLDAGRADDFSELSQRSLRDLTGHPGPERLAIVAAEAGELAKKLKTAREKLGSADTKTVQTRNGIYFEAKPIEGKVAFLFPGEMAQYPAMMTDAALAFPIVRDWFDFIGTVMDDRREVRLSDVMFPAPTLVGPEGAAHLEELLRRVDYGSEMVFAADQAVFTLLTSLGIRADAMLGHSTGENAALVASGHLDLDRDGVGKMIAGMNDIFATIEQSGVVPNGVLLTVAALDRTALLKLIEAHPDLHFTMDNCPNQAIIFGKAAEIDIVQAAAVAEGAVCTRLPISWGYHTRYVAPMADAFSSLFANIRITDSDVTLYSCATAGPFPSDHAGFQDTAVSQYVSRVRFTDAVNQLYEDGCRVFVECGPNTNLTAFVRDILGDRPHLAESADNRRHGMVSQLRHLVARLFVAGISADAGTRLIPTPDADSQRRGIARETYRKAPPLPSALPYVDFDATEGARLREILFGDGTGRVADAVQLPDREHPNPAWVRPAPREARIATASGAVSGHIDLMTSFLGTQNHVMQRTDSAGRGGPAARPTASSGRILVQDLSQYFDLGFDFRAYIMRGTPSFVQISPYLGESERGEAGSFAEKGAAGRAWMEWSLSRLAVKRAAAEVIAGATGIRPQQAGMEIRKNGNGAPYLTWDASSDRLPSISISHAEARGVGAAVDANWRIGIDFDLPHRIRDPGGFLETILGDSERTTLGATASNRTAVAAWSLKEAAAKAIGVGISGRPRAFEIAGFDPRSGAAQVAYGAQVLNARVRQVGDGICAVAYLPAFA